jgi:hypothetical protein
MLYGVLLLINFCHEFQTAILLLRIDDIVSGSKKKTDDSTAPTGPQQPTEESMRE